MSTSFQVNFEVSLRSFENSFAHWFKCIYGELRISQFVTNTFLVCYMWPQARSISWTNLILPVTFIKVWAIRIQNNMHCWCIEIKKSAKYKLMLTWVMFCSYCQIGDSPGYLNITVYLPVMLQASSHTAEGN